LAQATEVTGAWKVKIDAGVVVARKRKGAASHEVGARTVVVRGFVVEIGRRRIGASIDLQLIANAISVEVLVAVSVAIVKLRSEDARAVGRNAGRRVVVASNRYGAPRATVKIAFGRNVVVVIGGWVVIAGDWNQAPSQEDNAVAVVFRGIGVEVLGFRVGAAQHLQLVAHVVPVAVVQARAVARQIIFLRKFTRSIVLNGGRCVIVASVFKSASGARAKFTRAVTDVCFRIEIACVALKAAWHCSDARPVVVGGVAVEIERFGVGASSQLVFVANPVVVAVGQAIAFAIEVGLLRVGARAVG
jgi:hypothetical protein